MFLFLATKDFIRQFAIEPGIPGLSGIERFSTLALPGIALSRSGQDYDYLALDPSRVFVRAIPDTPDIP